MSTLSFPGGPDAGAGTLAAAALAEGAALGAAAEATAGAGAGAVSLLGGAAGGMGALACRSGLLEQAAPVTTARREVRRRDAREPKRGAGMGAAILHAARSLPSFARKGRQNRASALGFRYDRAAQ
jgi:hypothetical protein